jgi:hypothetical protein
MIGSKARAALFVAATLLVAVAAQAGPVRTERSACEAVKARVVDALLYPRSRIAFCDVIPRASSPRGYYVLALHSNRQCDGICSTNMGWFAVQRSTGRVFHWDVGEDRLGLPVLPGV